jgi:hypothetical protein
MVRLETGHQPGTEIRKLRVAQMVEWRDARLLTDGLDGLSDAFLKADSNIGKTQLDQIIAELARHIVA